MIHKRSIAKILLVCTLLLCVQPGARVLAAEAPRVVAETAVLMEAGSGKVLFGKDENKKIFPASMTKILTAMVALDYLDPGELIVCGSEVNAVPGDSSKAGHFEGETISVLNLLRGLIIMSGNETACVLAKAVAVRASGDNNMTYSAAERYFCDLMNQKAKALGAVNSNFTNPHGYHNDNMYSTAYDVALISREGMRNELIRQIAAETAYSGNGAGYAADASMKTKNYNWKTHNELIMAGQYSYSSATGIKTGYHSNAGYCVSASAAKAGTELIAVVCNSTEADRWTDSIRLFEYGFNNFANETIVTAWTAVGEIRVQNPRKQEPETMEYLITQSVESYINKDEIDRVIMEVAFLPELTVTGEAGETELVTPVEDGQILGKVSYSVGGAAIYTGYVVASRDALERNFSTDVDYFFGNITGFLFRKEAIPYWIIAVLLIIIIVFVIVRRAGSRKSIFSSSHRFYR